MATPGPSATQATNPETTALLQASIPQYSIPAQPLPHSKYSQLQALLEELGKEIRPTYAGNRMAMERLKKAIIRARILVREIQMEWSGTARSDGVIAVSLYELSEGDNLNRNGALIWHPLSSGSELAFDPCPVECALNCGVFRTCLASGPAAVWCALTDGSLAMCQVMEKTPQVRYEDPACNDIIFIVLDSAQQPVTSQVSSTMLTGSDASTSKVASVDSAGFVRLTDISIGGELFAARAHSHDWIGAAGGDCEAWCCKLLNGDNLLATGGDDSKLCVFDVRSDVTAAAAVNRKCHTAGVTAIDVVPQNEHLIFTGSYDSYLRLFDTRKLTKPISVSEMLPGGIWHATKTPPYSETPCISSSEWIAACMQGGLARFRMDHTVSEGDVFQILELCDVDSTTDKQRQLVYGVASNRDCVYAASFYTNTLACFKV